MRFFFFSYFHFSYFLDNTRINSSGKGKSFTPPTTTKNFATMTPITSWTNYDTNNSTNRSKTWNNNSKKNVYIKNVLHRKENMRLASEERKFCLLFFHRNGRFLNFENFSRKKIG